MISDTWTDGLEYDASKFELVVTVGSKTLTSEEYDFTYYYTPENEETEEIEEEKYFNLTLENIMDYNTGDTITVTYKLKVTADAINSKDTNNSATLT